MQFAPPLTLLYTPRQEDIELSMAVAMAALGGCVPTAMARDRLAAAPHPPRAGRGALTTWGGCRVGAPPLPARPPPLTGRAAAGSFPRRPAATSASATMADHPAQVGGRHRHDLHIYIEDTDCFQVVYNANYFKFFQRSLQAAWGVGELARLQRDEGITMRVVGVNRGKWASPAGLGDVITVETEVVACDGRTIRLNQAVLPQGSDKAHVSAELEVAFVDRGGGMVEVPKSLGISAPEGGATAERDATAPLVSGGATIMETPVTVFADECGPDGRACEVAILRWFERNRTDILGGPSGLKGLQDQGVLAVVALGGNMRFRPDLAPPAGAEAVVRSSVQFKRRNTTVVFRQEAWCEGELVAVADITVMSIDSTAMKPVPCPEETVARMVGLGATGAA
mmetsp:Transcript_12479/g.39499  ORF Transcript_12479/g.39499 Transcript_12479/m.39499 type:complete len:396 (+) Transcript_12479:946-2133(+)